MFIKLLFQSLLTFLALDAAWISQIATPWMKKAVPHLMSPNPNLVAAIAFYFLYLSTLLILFIMPGISQKVGYQTLAFQTFLFGFTAYATYDLTNLAVMKGYPASMAIADMIWGGVLTMVTALIVYKLNLLQ